MNSIMEVLLNRRSVRVYEDRPITPEVKDEILRATLRAPTAGNLMLYTIIEVTDQAAKDTLARTCDNQPFIAKAPLVLLFLADYQRWYDCFIASGLEQPRAPEVGDMLLACCDALIAAQTAVIAAESLGVGSCYIGDILEQYETHRDLFELPKYVLPICLLCMGYPTQQQRDRPLTSRFGQEFVVFGNRYKRLSFDEFEDMFGPDAGPTAGADSQPATRKVGQSVYNRKFNAGFTKEMNRSVRAMLEQWPVR